MLGVLAGRRALQSDWRGQGLAALVRLGIIRAAAEFAESGFLLVPWGGRSVPHASRSMVALCFVLAALAARVDPAEARRVALVIGNSAYEHTRVLPNARNDARLIAELLRKMGFAVTEASDVGYRPMREAIRAFGPMAQGAEMALVYFAGHGLEVAGENWLLPVSAAFAHERDLGYEAVSLSSILTAVKDATKLRLVILDACRNNPLGERIALSSAATRSVLRGLARVEPSGDILVAYSAKHGTLAEDGPAGDHSPFAAALALNMATPGLDIRIMLGKVRDAVKAATGGRQEPFTYGSVGGETIALLPGDGPTVAPVPRPVVVVPRPKTAIEAVPEIIPPVLPKIAVPQEPLPADIPISEEVLRLVETHPFFSNAPAVLAKYFRVTAMTRQKDGVVSTEDKTAKVQWLRRGVIKIDRIGKETTTSFGKRYLQTRSSATLYAANGFLLLGERSSLTPHWGPATVTDTDKLLHLDNLSGQIYPVRIGNRYSYASTHQQKLYKRNLRTTSRSCEVVEKFNAATLYSKLDGLAYVEVCEGHIKYQGTSIGGHSRSRSYFLEAYGIWVPGGDLEVDDKWTLKSFE